MVEIALFGGQGAAAMVAQSLRRLAAGGRAVRVAGLLNDQLPPGREIAGARVLGPFDSWRSLPETVLFIAPLPKAKDMQRRSARVLALGIPDARWASVVDPAACIADDAVLGAGCFVGAFGVVDAAARLGRHAWLWPAAQVGHDADVGDFVFLGRAAVVSGRCRLATGAHIGPGAVVRDGCRIGRFAIVGAGAVVIQDVPDHAIVAGNPARAIGSLDPADDPADLA